MLRIPTLLAAFAASACATHSAIGSSLIRGTLGSGARVSSSTAGAHWSVELRGSELLLRRDGVEFQILGAVPVGEPLDFAHTENQTEWEFLVTGGRTLKWAGREVLLGDRRWPGASGERTQVQI